MKKSKVISPLSGEFKKYLINNAKYFIFPKDIRPVFPVIQIVDAFGNIPLNSAAKYSQDNFIESIKAENIITNFDEILSSSNKYGISGYYYLKNEDLQNEFLTLANKTLFPIPLVVIELNKNDKTISSINLMVKIILAENLKICLMEHHNPAKIYLLISIEDKEFCQIAEREEMEFKLLDKNIRIPFVNTKEFKASIEPFLSRHYQQAIIAIISNMLDVEMLISQNVISNIFYTHRPNVTQKILNQIIKRKVPNPLVFFCNYFFEGKERIFKEIDLLWRYFGEATAIYYAFYGYWTIYYVFLALVGIVYACIYLSRLFNSEDVFTIYFIIFTVWNFIFLLRWRRKSEEIQHKWGMKMSSIKREIRDEFRGDEFYRNIDENLEKHVPEYSSVKVFVASLPLIIILLAADVIVFYYTTKWEEDVKVNANFVESYVPSIVRSLGLNAISFIYDWVANYFAEKENHKFQNEYNNILILKIFAFRLIADFTSVLYSIFVQKDIEKIKTQLYTNLIVKHLCNFLSKFIVPFLWRWYFVRRYFKYVEKKSIWQGEDKEKVENINEKAILTERTNNNKENKYYSRLESGDVQLEGINNVLKENNHFRLVPSISGKINKDSSQFNFNPDFIEITNILKVRGDLIYTYADLIIIHAICSMFAIIIPLAPIIVLIFSILTQNSKLYADLFYIKRAQAKQCNGIGIWYNILEVVSVLSIIFNCFLYYFYGKNFFIKEGQLSEDRQFTLGVNEKSLFYSVILEHGLILLQFALKFAVPSVPYWVVKERENLLAFYHKYIADREKIKSDELREQLRQFEKACQEKINNLISEKDEKIKKIKQYESSFNTLKDEIKETDKQIDESGNSVKFPRFRNIEKSKKGKIITLGENDSEDLIEDSLSEELMGFLAVKNIADIKLDLPLKKIVQELMENSNYASKKEIKDNKAKVGKVFYFNLIKNTFDKIEEEISIHKFKKYINNIVYPLVMCDLCLVKRVNFNCKECQKSLCAQCKNSHLSNSVYANHHINNYNFPISPELLGILKSYEDIDNNINDNNNLQYVKMEKFSFPKEMGNNKGYESLEKIFNFLYDEYFTKNGINSNNLIYIKNIMKNQMEFFDLLQEEPNQISEKEIINNIKNSHFNCEELFFINRICFKTFKFLGAKTTLGKIHKKLKKMQCGVYEEKLNIVMNVLDIYDNKMILRSEFEKFLVFITFQNFTQEYSIESLLNMIFKDSISIPLKEMYSSFINNKELYELMKYLLQAQ